MRASSIDARRLRLVALSIGVVLFAAPSLLTGYTTLGGSIGMSTTGNGYQRDVRVYNNFLDPAANSNQAPDAAYPGALGATLAVWKGAVAWASSTPTAARNFDFDWQGDATQIGAINDNVVSALPAGCGGGGTLAYTEMPGGDGWRIRYCEELTWWGGPGAPSGNQFDIEAVAVHELGHALCLGHAQNQFCTGNCNNDSTMCPAYCGNGVAMRTISADDVAGLQSIYGTIPANKPVITSLSGSTNTGGTLVITGSSLGSTANVKFTSRTSQDLGTIPGVVYGVPTSAGGTQISVVIPSAARDGNVLVWIPSNRLSNAIPIDINSTPPTVTSLSLASGQLRGGDTVSILGTDFATNAVVTFDSAAATVLVRMGSTQIDVAVPPGVSENQIATVSVTQASGTGSLAAAYTYLPNAISLEYVGTGVYGTPLTFTVYGPANFRVGFAIGPEGSFTHPATGLTFCFDRAVDFSRVPRELNTGAAGQVSVTWIADGVAGDRKGSQAALIGRRQVLPTNCVTFQIQ